jgi:uncharacterized protein involved in exopolysaccharide biosynthesis
LIYVEVDDTDPEFAADLANAYVQELGNVLGRMAVTEAQHRRVFFEKQLKEVAEKIKLAEIALQDSGVGLTALKSNPEATISRLAALQAQVTAQEIRLGSMRAYLAESAPEVRQGFAELSAMRAQLAMIEQTSATSSKEGPQYLRHYRDFKYYQTLFEVLSKQFELAKVDEALDGALIQVVDVAVPPETNSKPEKALIAEISALAAGFILLLFVLVRQLWRQTIKDPKSKDKFCRMGRTLATVLGRG